MNRLCAAFWLASWVAVAPLHAQDVQPGADEAYERSIDAALRAFDSENFSEAREKFEDAHARQPSARTLRGLGVTAAALRRYDLALHELDAALLDVRRPLTAAQRAEVTELARWIRTSLPTMQLQLTPAEARASVDGIELNAAEVRLDAGEHTLLVTAPGYRPHTDTFVLAPGQRATLRVALGKAAPELLAPVPQPGGATGGRQSPAPLRDSPALYERWWFWTAVGVVVAGGVAATVALTTKPEPRPYETGSFPVIRIGD